MRNGPKAKKMGQCTKSTRPGLPHTGRSHGRVPLARLLGILKPIKTPEESLRQGEAQEEARNCSRKADRSISKAKFTIKTEDLPLNSLRSFGMN
ncbi:hypothetical protein F383_28158 [Gossypium arboreum]|uniref:Uncharacterized protein n=1 Tax=Gossypium arboreum TaxID=29729 RepID=A0A0B0P3W7_GOSAR|nr:hypothetical protein F383_28158 [Gossypium arboreum]